ncbi:hypothetical protein B0H15DRAFT_908523 [Mycena belliarum]|uniref:Uncharacterized protein n=1 Tax=Mycena belliarum TaxID=1033014 RepID=A0AAD6U7R1_9AGAR|nr:hypothetical protein B0H15DRAFT_908523 [Mycena belliae]
MSNYWNSYPDFLHNSTAPLRQEFKLLAAHEGWGPKGSRFKKEWERCAGEEFSHHFGREESNLSGWQAMCAMVRLEEIPDSITQCRKMLREETWVNIYDLLDARRTGEPVKLHPSAAALRRYTKDTKKIFPKRAAKQNRFLKVLLIELL